MSENRSNSSTTPIRSTKRQRPYTSPDIVDGTMKPGMECDSDKVGNLTKGELLDTLMVALSNLMDQKLSNLATKEDLGSLTGKVTELAAENKKLQEEIRSLKAKEKDIKDKLVDLEGRSRRNNLIFRGLKWTGNAPDFKSVIRQFCNDVLGAGNNVWVNRAHLLGKDSSAVIAHIPEDTDINYILLQAKHQLKNTPFSIQRDFPKEVREKRAYLSALRAEIEKVAGRRRMPLIVDHLVVDGCRLTWEDGELKAGKQDGAEKLNNLFRHDFSQFLEALNRNGPKRIQHPERPLLPTPVTQNNTAATTTTATTASATGASQTV